MTKLLCSSATKIIILLIFKNSKFSSKLFEQNSVFFFKNIKILENSENFGKKG